MKRIRLHVERSKTLNFEASSLSMSNLRFGQIYQHYDVSTGLIALKLISSGATVIVWA